MLKDMASLIIKHTALSRRHLTPELVFRLITPSCPLWTARECEIPFKDPYWAFYWPGGQATARYILDNEDVVKNRHVLDVGCGCGAGAIAAAQANARYVLANDIDPMAICASNINSGLNKIKNIELSTKNVIGSKCENFDVILIGDMFYDEQFANILFKWLYNLSENGKTVLIGDPGRHGLTTHRRDHMSLMARYELSGDARDENNGFTETAVWTLNKQL